jgi:transcription regulator SarA/Rot-like protein
MLLMVVAPCVWIVRLELAWLAALPGGKTASAAAPALAASAARREIEFPLSRSGFGSVLMICSALYCARFNRVTPLLKRLEALGYIKRSRDPADERQVRVRLTETGRTLRAKALHIPGCILAASGLDAKKAKQLVAGIAALRHTLESYNPE